MENSRFCPNCGTKVPSDEQFCHNCGQRLENDVADQTNQSNIDNTVSDYQQPQNNDNVVPEQTQFDNNSGVSQQPSNNGNVTATRNSVKKNKKNKIRNRVIGILVAILVVVGFAGYLFGNHYYSKSAVLDRAMTSLTDDKNTDSYFESTDSNVTVSDSTMAPLSKHMNKNNDDLESLKSQLSSSGESKDGNFEYTQDGKKWFIFPNYKVKVKPVVPSITTSVDSADVTLNGKSLGKTGDSQSEFSLGHILPGDYDISVSKKLSGKNVPNNQSSYIDSSNDIYMPLKTIKFTVNAGPNADVYINDEKIGTTDNSGSLKVSERAYSSTLYVYGVLHTDGNTTKSDKYHLSEGDDGQEVDLNYPGSVDKDDASDKLNDFVSDLGSAVNDNSDFDASQYFVNGSSNSDAQETQNWIKGEIAQINDNKFDSVSIEPTVNSTVPAGDHSIVSGTFKYDFDVPDDDGGSHDHIQIFKFTSNMKKTKDGLMMQTFKIGDKVKDYDKNDDDDD